MTVRRRRPQLGNVLLGVAMVPAIAAWWTVVTPLAALAVVAGAIADRPQQHARQRPADRRRPNDAVAPAIGRSVRMRSWRTGFDVPGEVAAGAPVGALAAFALGVAPRGIGDIRAGVFP